jgi:hypothetical protein
MAELELAAAIIGLAGAATNLSVGIFRLADNISNARPEARIIASGISLLSRSLRELAKSFKKAKKLSPEVADTASELVDSCKELIRSLRRSLAKSPLSKSKGQAFIAGVVWPFKKNRVDFLRSSLESLKTTLLLLLATTDLKKALRARATKPEK